MTATPARTQHDLLPASTGMGAVTLAVHDLDAMIDFYQRGVGLAVLDQRGHTATLGRQGVPAMILNQDGSLAHAPSGAAGLYHTAFLYPQQSELASSVYSLARNFARSFTGSSDHLVSEALYFDDPEGNGVELYWDRPRDAWTWQSDRVQMATNWLDPNQFLREHLTQEGAESVADTAASVGHVHLKVGDLATARAFYVDTLGFEVTAEYGSQALFVAAGGYHHHLGMNTWESRGAAERSPALGLGEVVIDVADEDALSALAERLSARGLPHGHDGRELSFLDPWANRIRVQASGSAS
ncbi:VOC family protein [Leucobacter sp. M11]|uniref:VOC family protein n=1 Tax=Leucobacter sp. M11 TaxID=2993565 RepID=UPI002D7E6E19|nr:VOC family protein [Leucobacter sp. M11]MEB4614529.1 VOC family protein [Leucobacter sp. M11]